MNQKHKYFWYDEGVLDKSKDFMPHALWVYIVGWIFFVYLFIQIMDFQLESSNNILLSGLYMVEFGVHEVSHLIFAFLPAIYVALAGSVGEIAFTVLLLFATLKGKAYFAAVFAGLWIMLAMHNVGRYMADARSMALPLVGPGGAPKHDWNFIFGELGWLNYDTAIGGTVILVGTLIGALGLGFGVYLIGRKIYMKKHPLKPLTPAI